MMTKNKSLQKVLSALPKAPGIYKMIDKEGKILYVGKAKDISKRIRQYFQKNYEHSTRTRKLIENVDNIDTIVVDSELEAMILEHNLIKQLQPKYNVIMKDDKNYVYIKITRARSAPASLRASKMSEAKTSEDFPRVQIVRRIEKDNAKYIGPKTAAHKVQETFKILKKIFPFRHCGLNIEMKEKNEVKVTNKVIKYPCLDYYIKRCIAPCIGKCTVQEYQEIIKNVENFLKGKTENILKDLKLKMQEYAMAKNFEKAAKIRDKLLKIEEIVERQKVQDQNQEDKDVINYCISQDRAYFNLFQIRDGRLIGQENFILSATDIDEQENKEVLESFIYQYYKLATDIPKEILIPHEIDNQKGIKMKIIIPKIGTKNKLLEMSLNNARIFADRNKPSWQEESELTKKATEELRKLLNIKEPLKRMECYDISHLSGTDTVGSMIVFENGVPKNSLYRKFKLKTVDNKPDDYKSMEEVLYRRFSKIAISFLHKDYKLRKALKKDKKFIETHNKVHLDKTDREFFVLTKGQEQIGFAAIRKHSDKIFELRNVWIKKDSRGKKLGHKLVNDIIHKNKLKRVYAICKAELKEYYLLAGFEEINKLPEEMCERLKYCRNKYKNVALLVYDSFKHKEDESFKQIPDLVIIDGGKGQLSAATNIFKKLNIQIPYIALAKQFEEIFRPHFKNPIILPSNNEALKLLQRARDEAHRFAISYNKNLRKFKK